MPFFFSLFFCLFFYPCPGHGVSFLLAVHLLWPCFLVCFNLFACFLSPLLALFLCTETLSSCRLWRTVSKNSNEVEVGFIVFLLNMYLWLFWGGKEFSHVIYKLVDCSSGSRCLVRGGLWDMLVMHYGPAPDIVLDILLALCNTKLELVSVWFILNHMQFLYDTLSGMFLNLSFLFESFLPNYALALAQWVRRYG